MVPQKPDDIPVKQVNNILQNLRGEHFRHTRNAQGKPASSTSVASHAHNQPSLPINLIYPSAPTTNPSWVPGPSPPRSWRSPATPTPTPDLYGVEVRDTVAWRERALMPLFSASPASSSSETRLIFPDPSPIPQLTLLCLQLIRSTCLGADLAGVTPYIPLHLRRVLLRYTAIHAPLSQTELDALCHGTSHVNTELIVIGPYNILRGGSFRKNDCPDVDGDRPHGLTEVDGTDSASSDSWDAVPTRDGEPLALRSLVVLSSPLSAPTVLAFPPTITHLALIDIPHRISLHRLPAICPLLVFLDLSYNTWLCAERDVGREAPMLEEVPWERLRRLAVVGLRGCSVTPKVLLELNRGRWDGVRVVQ